MVSLCHTDGRATHCRTIDRCLAQRLLLVSPGVVVEFDPAHRAQHLFGDAPVKKNFQLCHPWPDYSQLSPPCVHNMQRTVHAAVLTQFSYKAERTPARHIRMHPLVMVCTLSQSPQHASSLVSSLVTEGSIFFLCVTAMLCTDGTHIQTDKQLQYILHSVGHRAFCRCVGQLALEVQYIDFLLAYLLIYQ